MRYSIMEIALGFAVFVVLSLNSALIELNGRNRSIPRRHHPLPLLGFGGLLLQSPTPTYSCKRCRK